MVLLRTVVAVWNTWKEDVKPQLRPSITALLGCLDVNLYVVMRLTQLAKKILRKDK